MGDVICVYRILPSSPEKFDSIRKALEELKPERIEEEPIAFGLKSIKLTKVIPDGPGEQDELEKKIESIDGVDNIETVMVSRSL